ncbi:pentapeptide repeat-containing protein [Nocardia sp. NPDC049737]|uniref:pentapeptide repeat-containing protein n=1 Tax=Nocardia sp. NPDC049737 TaxID=3154358 RepID=UPI003417C77F
MTNQELRASLPAEHRLLAAFHAGESCRLISPEDCPSPEVITGWRDPDREVRAAFLRELLLADGADSPEIDLRGAIITGTLDLSGITIERSLALGRCLIAGDIIWNRSRFNRDVTATVCTFTSDIRCADETVFKGKTNFDTTHFLGNQTNFSAQFAGETTFDNSHFTGNASFNSASFYRNCKFRKAIFEKRSFFKRVQFCADAEFTEAKFALSADWSDLQSDQSATNFDAAIFAGDGRFENCLFNRKAAFNYAHFEGTAIFSAATFKHLTEFARSKFIRQPLFRSAAFWGSAIFGEAEFSQGANFQRALFGRNANFYSTTFAGEAHFEGAVFMGDYEAKLQDNRAAMGDAHPRGDEGTATVNTTGNCGFFKQAIFSDIARFTDVLANDLQFTESTFRSTLLIRTMTAKLDLRDSVFYERPQVIVGASEVDCTSIRLHAGAEFRFCATTINLTNAEFSRISTISGIGLQDVYTSNPVERPPYTETRNDTLHAAHRMYKHLRESAAGPTQLSSLRGASVIDALTVSDLDLTMCRFAGAHGIDKLRITPTCTLRKRPTTKHFRLPLWFTQRSVLYEEELWRRDVAPQFHRRTSTHGQDTTPSANELPNHAELARIYRDLRKRLEDVKDAPGAADFYYGEMEMRRLSGRKPIDGCEGGKQRGVWERGLLHLYWMGSGYGLRASRTLLWLILALMIATAIFATVGTKDGPMKGSLPQSVALPTGNISYPTYDRSVASALSFSVHTGTTLLRYGPIPPLTIIGEITDIVLRLAVPILLALIVLAIRGRIKR